jgi:hypothetical protein
MGGGCGIRNTGIIEQGETFGTAFVEVSGPSHPIP